MNAFLTLPSFLFRQLVWARGRLYDRGILPVEKAACPVISVGNLTAGGTGKTPFSIWLIERLLRRGISPGFVSRGYKSNGSGAREVTKPDPQAFGDEPSLVREKFPEIPIFIGAERPAVIERLLEKAKVDIVVADDAFQHRRLRRDLDIVLLDALAPSWHYEFLPLGRAREGFSALSRAHFVVLSKMNLASPSQKKFLLEKIEKFGIRHLEMDYICGDFTDANGKSVDLHGPVFLVSGVAQPESVRALIREPVAQHKIFSDHHDYTDADADRLLQEFQSSGAKSFVTTAKDAVKLRRFSQLRPLILEMHLSLTMRGDVDELDDQIDRLVRPRA